MEIIRRDTDYAVRALLFLALAEGDDVRCIDLANECGIPRSFAYKILRSLADAGLVVGQAGRTGGFHIDKAPKDVTLIQVVEAVQGPMVVSRCVGDPVACDRRPECPVSTEWKGLQNMIVNFLGRTTMKDLLGCMGK